MRFYNIFKSFFQETPYLIFFVTARCNSRCRMCFYWKNLAQKQNELTLNEINLITKKAGKILHVSLSGGEPFLRDDIERICYLFYKNNQTRFITIPTNGLLPSKIAEKTEQIINSCRKANISVDLSLDGVGKVHDNIRGVPGNFEKLLETYNLLNQLKKKYSNLKIQINTVVSSFNKDNIEELVPFVKANLKNDGHAITLARGDTREAKAKEVSVALLRKVYSLRPKRKGSFFQKMLEARAGLVKKFTLRILEENRMPLSCLAGKKMIIITETGMVYPCEILNMSFGDLRKNSYNIRKLLNTKRARKILKHIKDKKCYCTFECAISNSILYDFKTYPALIKEFIKSI